jgi:hypothetical protein
MAMPLRNRNVEQRAEEMQSALPQGGRLEHIGHPDLPSDDPQLHTEASAKAVAMGSRWRHSGVEPAAATQTGRNGRNVSLGTSRVFTNHPRHVARLRAETS